MSPEEVMRTYYRALADAWGAQHWWPARSRFEVIVGAILTQNTAWINVERALENLRQEKLLSAPALRKIPLRRLEQEIRPSGYFRQKARRLKNFVRWLEHRYDGSLSRMFAQPTAILREQLLRLNGVGPETADSILLYAGGRPVFVVDAYTRRILERHGLIRPKATYEQIRDLVERALAENEGYRRIEQKRLGHFPSPMSMARRSAVAQRYNEMHGLIVRVGKYHCRKKAPACAGCPLEAYLPERSR